MVDISPQMAFLSALQGNFSAAQQGSGGGSGSGIPGLSTPGTSEVGNALSGSGGITGGGVPSTATTGASIANALIGGGGGADPLSQQVLQSAGSFASRDPGERGDLGAGVTGGDLETLLAVLGGPAAFATILGSLVGSTELGLPPSTSLGLSDFEGGGQNIGSLGISNRDRETGLDARDTGLNPFLNNNIGSLGIPRNERELFSPERSQGIGSLGIAFADRETGIGRQPDLGNALSTPRTNTGSLGISNRDRDRAGPPGRNRSGRRETTSQRGGIGGV